MTVTIDNKFLTASIDASVQRQIEVVASIMGTGKSTAIINWINENPPTPEKPMLIILPYLGEIERFKRALKSAEFVEPEIDRSAKDEEKKCTKDTKRKVIQSLLLEGKNIITTHALFELLTEKSKDAIRNGGYTIVLDEILGCIKPQNDITPQMIIDLIKLKYIQIDPNTCQINWDDNESGLEYKSTKEFNKVHDLCSNGVLYMLGEAHQKKIFIQELPADLFQIADKYIILTYQFDESDLKWFFDIKGVEWSYNKGVIDSEREAKIKANIKNLIKYEELPVRTSATIRKLLAGNNLMTKNWYDNLKQNDATSLRNFFRNTLKRTWDVTVSQLLYTGPKDWCSEEGKQKKHLRIPSFKDDCWVAFNTKGTNDFADRNFVLFNYRLCPIPTIPRYFERQTKHMYGSSYKFDTKAYNDAYALNHMIQFIFRSAIRDGKPIRVFIANPVMKKLFQGWVDKVTMEGQSVLAQLSMNNMSKAA